MLERRDRLAGVLLPRPRHEVIGVAAGSGEHEIRPEQPEHQRDAEEEAAQPEEVIEAGAVEVPEDFRMQLTLGTSFAVILPTGLRSFLAQRARGAVDMAALKRLTPAVFLGVLFGVLIASKSSSAALRWVWVIAAAAMALKLALGREDWKLADALPATRREQQNRLTAGFRVTPSVPWRDRPRA